MTINVSESKKRLKESGIELERDGDAFMIEYVRDLLDRYYLKGKSFAMV